MNLWQKIKSIFQGNKKRKKRTQRQYPTTTKKPLPTSTIPRDTRFSKQRTVPASQGRTTKLGIAGIGVAYDPTLLLQLKKEHQEILQLYTEIHLLMIENQFSTALKTLIEFKTLISNHLYLENLKLYIYLQESLRDHPEKFKKMRKFRKEMDSIGQTAIEFFSKYEKDKLSSNNKAEFLAEFKQIGAVLGQRIKHEEEQLYPMYQQRTR